MLLFEKVFKAVGLCPFNSSLSKGFAPLTLAYQKALPL
jgi:hypothetical protein